MSRVDVRTVTDNATSTMDVDQNPGLGDKASLHISVDGKEEIGIAHHSISTSLLIHLRESPPAMTCWPK